MISARLKAAAAMRGCVGTPRIPQPHLSRNGVGQKTASKSWVS
jgi:hypothetical protein